MDDRMQELLTRGAALLTQEGAREVYVFGSVAAGRAHEESDLDLAVAGLPPERFSPPWRAWRVCSIALLI